MTTSEQNIPGELNPEEFKSLMDYDPFAEDKAVEEAPPEKEEEKTPTSSSPSEENEGEDGLVVHPAAKQYEGSDVDGRGKVAEPTKGKEPSKQADKSLEDQVKALKQELEQLRKPQAPAPATATGKGKEAPKQEELPNYALEIPHDMIRGLRSEDEGEFAKALQGFTNGILTYAHKQVREELNRKVSTLGNAIPTFVTQKIQETRQAEQVFNDFYGEYPELNKPELYPTIQSIGEAVMKDFGGTWSQGVRDEVARRAFISMGYQPLQPVSQRGQRRAPGPQAPTTRTRPGSGGSSPGARPVTRTEQDDIQDTLFGSG